MENNNLKDFGKEFIESVRDNTLTDFEKISKGELRSKRGQELFEKISQFDEIQLETIKDIVRNMVDKSIFNTLFFFEENEEWIISNPENDIDDINELSDGLSGELYTDDGWISKFSKFPKTL